MSDCDMQALTIDTGSGMCKLGFSGDDEPRAVFSSVVGHLKSGNKGEKDCIVGDEAVAKRETFHLKFPIKRGLINDWDDMEKLWHHSFYNELRVVPENHPVLLADVHLDPKSNLVSREKMADTMFERFNVHSLHIGNQCVHSLFLSGRTTGIVLDSGHGVTQIVPIHEGFAQPEGIMRMDLSGQDITDYLVKIICERGYDMNTKREFVQDSIKEKLCYIAFDYNEEMIKAETSAHREHDYFLPDGSKIAMAIGNERFRAPEILFQPALIGSELPGIHQMIFNSIKNCDVNKRKELYQNIVLSGGSSMFEGLNERLTEEITKLAPRNARIKVITRAERKYSVWIGGNWLLCSFEKENKWITKEEYGDVGASIVHRKCKYF